MTSQMWAVSEAVVPVELRDAALRRMNLLIRDWWTPATYQADLRTTFFPAARWCSEFLDLQAWLCDFVGGHADVWCDPQLLVRFPDDCADWPWTPHVDEPPPWAAGRTYRLIAGIPLTDHQLAVFDPDPTFVNSTPGDLIQLTPGVRHQSTPNRTPVPRIVIWYRLLHQAR